jgi:hypothetical protein
MRLIQAPEPYRCPGRPKPTLTANKRCGSQWTTRRAVGRVQALGEVHDRAPGPSWTGRQALLVDKMRNRWHIVGCQVSAERLQRAESERCSVPRLRRGSYRIMQVHG